MPEQDAAPAFPELRIKLVIGEKEWLSPKIIAADLIAFERQYNLSSGDFLEQMRTEWLVYVGHHALEREGKQKVPPFEELLAGIERVNPDFRGLPEGGDEGKGPALNRAARRGSSRRSSASSGSRGSQSPASMTGS